MLRALVLETPPNLVEHGLVPGLPNCCGRELAGRLTKLDLTAKRDLLALFANRPAIGSTAGSRAIRSRRCSASTASSATYASPYTPGSAYVLLHHVFGEVNGKKGVWGHAIGGMGAITQAMAKACAARASTSAPTRRWRK